MKKKTIGFTVMFASLAITIAIVALQKSQSKAEESVVYYHADYLFHDTQDSLMETSNVIISGEIIDSDVNEIDISIKNTSTDPQLNPGSTQEETVMVYTVSKVRITQVFKGDVKKGDVIEVKQMGGVLDKTEYRNEGTAYLKKSAQYLLFLMGFDDPDMPYSLLNPVQAQYQYSKGGYQKLPDNNLDLDVGKLSAKEYTRKCAIRDASRMAHFSVFSTLKAFEIYTLCIISE